MNGSCGFMDSSIAIRRYPRMGSLDSGKQSADAITRPAFEGARDARMVRVGSWTVA